MARSIAAWSNSNFPCFFLLAQYNFIRFACARSAAGVRMWCWFDGAAVAATAATPVI
jgi:hypothetical protein